ncbi:MAG TPA: aminomethyl-transferring glycine dehydrogenase subunit GcvPA [Thermoflexales bacterium]|nr:aminomethyl-transferring glycine dehydrogenase subunit GcvPA [Thermoflexales bacterium]HQW35039.1 aminomethyl-transferring glycine dehydrogenase subunit GcvPA [Thermoflexales bacterium]HQZ22035.1 aminomethyl-transferring glycine dehydrogenase subunit GcvPA [Thermoflexales bacterium]HQZ99787.1 aminomethyl-transferring glycine dehydrogenase subunit GcvPA [Thermoflexales bacterium]
MNYLPHTDAERAEMLKIIGANSIDELFDAIPEKYRFPKLDLPEPLTEMEVMWEMQSLTDANADVNHYACFLGAGAYNHYVPSLVDHILRRGEFLTAYTPYQPEVAQGTLQSIFEFQSMVGQLTGMDIATASHYDGATSFTEAALMAMGMTRRQKVLVSPGVHPQYRQVLRTYTQFNTGVKITGDENLDNVSLDALLSHLDKDTAAVCVSNPDFFGNIIDLKGVAEKVHAAGAMLIVSVNPISLGLLKPPGEFGADIVTGEGQPLGIPVGFGGPYLGFFCTRREHMRRIPGRIVGETVDRDGKRGFVLTLKTREQDIRREKATSNICTNQGLMMTAACVYLSVMGKHGVKQAANLSYQKAHYAAEQIGKVKGFSVWNKGPFFNEFVIKCPKPVSEINDFLLDETDIIGGYDLGKDYPELKDHMLVCCTETNTKDEIDALAGALAEL